MRPLLRDGDLVLVEPLDTREARSLSPGEVVLLVRENEAVVHRIVGRRENGTYRERGDRAQQVRQVAPEEIVGRVTARRRGGQRRAVSRPWWWKLRERLGGGRDRG